MWLCVRRGGGFYQNICFRSFFFFYCKFFSSKQETKEFTNQLGLGL
jgi:hypothetical protein